MALRKEIATDYGINAVYWNIQRIDWRKNGACAVSLYGYQSEDARKAGHRPLATRVTELHDILFTVKDNPIPSLYEAVTKSRVVEKDDGTSEEINEFVGGEAC